MDANIRLPSISALNLPPSHPSPPPTPLTDRIDPKIWTQARASDGHGYPSTPPATPPSYYDHSLPPISGLLKSVPPASSRVHTPVGSPTRASFVQTQKWPGVRSLGPIQGEVSGSRSCSLPDINNFPETATRSSSLPDIRYWTPNSLGPSRTQPRRNSRQEPYSRGTETAAAKKASKKAKREQRASSGGTESEDEPISRNNTKYTDEQNHFVIYHHDDLEWTWKEIEEAYMKKWPKQGKEQPERTEGALQCAFYRTNAIIPALLPGDDLLVLGHPKDFIQGKPAKTGKDNSKREVPREFYELYQVFDGVPHLLEEIKVRSTDVARKLCLRYPEAMMGYDWVRPEDRIKAQMIAAKRQLQRHEWKQKFYSEAYKDGSYLHKLCRYVSVTPQQTFEPLFQYYSKPAQRLPSMSFSSHFAR
ncbi:hypothetical protein QBC44DRAFT_364557 [Cladorrhinum sp. PSN332]|nr:hypothetical protein QBC44DRAFT_364557 [Cladorrhinum sp. PSN332]